MLFYRKCTTIKRNFKINTGYRFTITTFQFIASVLLIKQRKHCRCHKIKIFRPYFCVSRIYSPLASVPETLHHQCSVELQVRCTASRLVLVPHGNCSHEMRTELLSHSTGSKSLCDVTLQFT